MQQWLARRISSFSLHSGLLQIDGLIWPAFYLVSLQLKPIFRHSWSLPGSTFFCYGVYFAYLGTSSASYLQTVTVSLLHSFSVILFCSLFWSQFLCLLRHLPHVSIEAFLVKTFDIPPCSSIHDLLVLQPQLQPFEY